MWRRSLRFAAHSEFCPLRAQCFALKSHALSKRQPNARESDVELAQARAEIDRLVRENAELRTRAILDEQLGSDAARYQAIFANLAEGIVLQAADGQTLTCNAAAERILGLSVEQMSGRSSLDPRWRAIHEDGSPFPSETHPAMVSLRTSLPMHAVTMGVHKPNGSLTWISINSQPLFGGDSDRPHAVVTSLVDITTRKQSEQRMHESEQKLRGALDAARMATWDWDIETGKVERSANVEAILGLEPGTLAPTYEGYLALVHPDDRSEFDAAVQRSLASEHGDDFVFEHRIVHPDDSIRWVANSGRVTRNDRGEPISMAGTVADISPRKFLEDQLMLSQRMETVGRLAGGVAHDFNNLLMGILDCTEFASARPGLEPEVRGALDTIREASEKAAGLTRQLLSFARRQVFDLRVLDLSNLIAETGGLLSRIIGEDIEIHTKLGDEQIPIRADQAQIEQVIVNLAVNARDAMPKGGTLDIEVGTVRVDAAPTPSLPAGHYALLELRDNGQGISKTSLPHIFDPFFTTKKDGVGLGLATTYGIVTQLGGDILVDSEPGVGTRFAIYLPLTSDHVETVDERPPARRATAGPGRILLAEDDAIVRMVAERGLRTHGYEVIAVPDGHTALALLAAGELDVDLLVSDVIMPNMTGYELAQKLRAQLPELKVLFVSGYADGAFDPDGPGHDITDAIYLPKPYTGSQLAGFVERILAD